MLGDRFDAFGRLLILTRLSILLVKSNRQEVVWVGGCDVGEDGWKKLGQGRVFWVSWETADIPLVGMQFPSIMVKAVPSREKLSESSC